ncbi:hypothetical protein QNA08_10290 [Chelatococcus sp. SYSU_G07232]|uniref:Glycine zipper domain-containing protein n=1 Tax=Chelatococcus albus TaxID=3047466 RepID=A0ABT7AGZ0_9HYPH|nr:hypothetical protein [Chelatococcus sp. SYSU_G07232]MDJ1158623.1 hypothetical protein [Chelatococcus sp. SYSU_G07232]
MKKWLAIGVVALSVAACYTPEERAVGGALIGGAAGAAIGGAATGRAGGAVAGGIIGAAGGAMIGAATAPCRTYYYRGRRYQECY